MGQPIRLAATIVAVAAACAAVAAQDRPAGQGAAAGDQSPSQATFRAVANYVELDVSVTDETGSFVRNLTANDFTVVEMGRPQALSFCTLIDIPLERLDRPLYQAAAIARDVASNGDVNRGRVYLLVLDGYHIAAENSSKAKREARRFVERYVGDHDLVAIAQIGDPASGQEFTSSKVRMLASIDRFQGQKPISAAVQSVAAAVSAQDLTSAQGAVVAVADPEAPYRAHAAITALRGMQQLVESLSGVTGRRKAMVLFSEGVDYDTIEQTVQGNERRVEAAEAAMIAAATRANVLIYPVDPRGLVTGNEQAIQIGALPAGGAVPNAAMQDELWRAHESLLAFANETGGRAALESNDLDVAFERVMRDNSTYYVLGYNSGTAHDGRFHDVRVKISRPGLQVRARQGYYAPFSDGRDRAAATMAASTDPLEAALQGALPAFGLGLRAQVAVVAAATPKLRTVHLTLEAAPGEVTFEAFGMLYRAGLDVAYRVYDAKGAVRASSRKEIGLKLKPPNRDRVTQDGLRYVFELDLPPGDYQLRIAGRDSVTGRVGSVFADVTVPPIIGPIGVGDLLLTSTRTAGMFTTGDGPAAGSLLPGPTTAVRQFGPDDVLTAAAPLQWADPAHAMVVDLRTSVRADDGTEVFAREEQRDSRSTSTLATGTAVAEIPLARFRPGRYVLTIEARLRQGGAPIVRELAFDVVAGSGR